MNNIDKLRKEYREKVGSTYNMTFEWYAEWLEKQLIETRAEVVNKNDLLQRVRLSLLPRKIVEAYKDYDKRCHCSLQQEKSQVTTTVTELNG